ncbi:MULTISPECIES: hypothetical protein [Streptomyces]|nr:MULTISPECIES: hypothetical protein [Streptomyces]MCC2280794.1 hypothetical protein [Streptomyces sp. ET3-23]GHF19828.1 hypothetical protein GCM10010359_21320 [Streptomyces morookaense]
MRLFRTAVSALGGLLLAVSLPAATAGASGGEFHWRGPEGKPYFITNPPDGKCLAMAQEARQAENRTKGVAVVYAEKGCKGAQHRLGHGEKAPVKFVFKSVKFGGR